jgi:hypothetical protein
VKKLLMTCALLGLTACAQPEPIVAYDVAYTGKGDPVVSSVRPKPRPMQRVWLACPEAAWNDDCGNNEETSDAPTDSVDTPDPVSTPDVGTPDVPDAPAAPEPTREPDPEPVSPSAPEPTPEPEPETHEPPPPEPEWCPA